MSEYHPQIICLQETNFKPQYSPIVRHYDVYNNNRVTGQKASGGVAILIAEGIHSEQLALTTNLEAVATTVWIPSPITVCNIYLPASHNLSSQELTSLISQLPTPFILTGDFNAHNQLWGSKTSKPRGKMIENLLLTHTLNLLNTGEPTHFNASSGTFSNIDLSFCNPSLSTTLEWHVLDSLYDSDHFPILIDSMNANVQQEVKFIRWTLKKADWCAYSDYISDKISSIEVTEDVNTSLARFIDLMKTAAVKFIGQTSGYRNRKCVPWWNKQCAEAVKKSKTALNKLKKNNSLENLIEFKKLKAEARKIIRKSKTDTWATYVSTLTTSTPYNQVWDKVRKINGISRTHQISALKDNHDRILSANGEIANLLAQTFQSHSNTIYQADTNTTQNATSESRLTTDDDRQLNMSITMNELKHAIKCSKDSAAGPDEIPFAFLKHLPDTALLKLLALFNEIWLNKKFPKLWQTAIIFPIHKTGKSKLEPTNYRPISLTCTMCKLIEKIINARLMWFLEKRELIVKEQNGFRQNRSTLDNLVQFQTEISDAFANKQDLMAVFFDIQHAFDSTRRDSVISKLAHYGITGNTFAFIKNFLSQRSFKVKINGTESETLNLDNGIPQGSVLSSTLFLVAINDLTSGIKAPVKASLYADDLLLYCRGKDINTIHTLIQHAVDDIVRVSKTLGFKLSTSKSNTMRFSRKPRKTSLPPIQMYNTTLPEVTERRFLGLLFDCRLTWRAHIKQLKADCITRLNIIKILSHHNWGAQEAIILRVYRSLIRSKLDYGSIIYASASKSALKSLNVIQNTALRLATGALPTSPVTSLERETNEPPLWIRRQYLTAKYASRMSIDTSKPVYSSLLSTANKMTPPSLPDPSTQRIKDLLPFDANSIQNLANNNSPPWCLEIPIIDTTLAQYKKEESPKELLRSLHLEVLAKYPHDTILYTDGSKSSSQTSSAVFGPEVKAKFRLPSICSIFSAELFAILKALNIVLESNNKHSTICSDSKSAIDAIGDIYTKNTLARRIQNLHTDIVKANKRVNIIWTPSHCGIRGNEEADKLAKLPVQDLQEEPLFLHQDILHTLKQSMKETWQRHWDSQTNKLRIIEPTISYTPLPNLTRHEEIVIRRLRIGHTHLTHDHIFTKEEPPVCDPCYSVPLTVEHILTSCIRYNLERYEAELDFDLKEAMGLSPTSVSHLLRFLKITNLYSQI